MLIKLQPEQTAIFWSLIKQSMISAYKIPKDFQQDFTNRSFEHHLSGLAQCWFGYKFDDEGNRRLQYIATTKISDEKNYGVKALLVDTLYGFRLISQDLMDELYEGIRKFAKANDCNVIVAEYSNKRIGQILESLGFEKHKTICRKIL